jgi:hypothetical protein
MHDSDKNANDCMRLTITRDAVLGEDGLEGIYIPSFRDLIWEVFPSCLPDCKQKEKFYR